MIRRMVVALFATLLLVVLTACGGGGSNPGGGGGGGGTPLFITTDTLPDGVLGKAYTVQMMAAGGVAPYTWSASSLTDGLSIDSRGLILGAPANTNGNIVITVQDSGSPRQSVSKSFRVTINPPLVIFTDAVAGAHINVPYDFVIQATGVPVTTWTIVSGQLPSGFALASPSSTQVEIKGTPTQTESTTFTLEAQSGGSNPPQLVRKAYTLVVDDNLAVVTGQLFDIIRNRPYQDSLSAVNGTPPYHWSIQSGTLPSGIMLDSNSGILNGTFTTGSSGFNIGITFQVTDSSSPARSGSRLIPINAVEQLGVSTGIASGTIGQLYSGFAFASGGRQPYSWSLVSGSLPPGLVLNQLGQISGVPTQLGDFNFALHVQDSTNPPQTADSTFTISIRPSTLTTSNSLPARIPLNLPFSGFVAAQGGTPPYTWQVANGNLPVGLQLNSGTGELSGTPTTLGTYTFTVRVTDSSPTQQNAIRQFSMIVATPLGRNDSIQKATLIGNGSYTASISPYADPVDVANPDVDFYKIIVNNGTPVSLNTSAKSGNSQNPLDTVIELVDVNGVRLNTCNPPNNQNGAFVSPCINDDIQAGIVQDSVLYYLPSTGPSGLQSVIYAKVFDWRGDARPDMTYTLNVSGAVSLLTLSQQFLPQWPTGSAYNQTLSASGGTGSYTWSVSSGTLPPGIVLSTSGVLNGTPTTAGTYTFTVTVTDQGSPPQTASQQFTIQIL